MTVARPFRFGVTADRPDEATGWTALARDIETAGYDSLLVPDTAHTAAPFVALAAAGAATSTLRLGTWVVCDPLRTPQHLAWEARTLWELFGPRVQLGLGAGRPGAEVDAAAVGVAYGTSAERVRRLAGTLRLLRFELPELRLLVAAAGPRMLRLAGAAADTVALAVPPDADAERVRSLVASIGVDRELAMGLVAVGGVATPWLAHVGLDAAGLATRGAVTVVTGTAREMAEQLLRRREELGVSYLAVPEQAARSFAPVVELLAGR